MLRPALHSTLLGIGLAGLPALAMAATPDQIRACNADRQAEGCTTLLSQFFVCAQAPAISGCAELLAMRDEALIEPEPLPEDEIEPPVTPRAEGELAEDASADAGVAEGVQREGDSAVINGDCPVIDSADWRASVGSVDGAEGPHLIVEGRVTLPTPAWQVELTPGMADRSAMPVQRVILTATPPQMDVMQVLADYELRLETPSISAASAGSPPYSGVLILCGGTVLAEINQVSVAD